MCLCARADQLEVFLRPSRTGMRGPQPRAFLERVISGQSRLELPSGMRSKICSLSLPKFTRAWFPCSSSGGLHLRSGRPRTARSWSESLRRRP